MPQSGHQVPTLPRYFEQIRGVPRWNEGVCPVLRC